MSRDQHSSFRLNGGRFYQQPRRVRKRDREYVYSYWYCRSGWGKVTHLGAELPAQVEAARAEQWSAADTLAQVERVAALLRRFVAGDVLSAAEREGLAALGFTLPDEVLQMAQQTRPELTGRSEEAWERTRAIADEVLSEEDKAMLVRLGLTRFVRRPDPTLTQTVVCANEPPGRRTNAQE
jgi:hypothetical protein